MGDNQPRQHCNTPLVFVPSELLGVGQSCEEAHEEVGSVLPHAFKESRGAGFIGKHDLSSHFLTP